MLLHMQCSSSNGISPGSTSYATSAFMLNGSTQLPRHLLGLLPFALTRSLPMDQQAIAAAYVPHNGPALIGTNLVWMLYGCFLVQLHNYAINNSSTDRWLRVLVSLVSVTGGLHLFIVTSTQWSVLVENWGDAQIWAHLPWTAAMTPTISALNGVIVQSFFVGQILRLAGHIIVIRCVAIAIACAALIAVGGGIADSIMFLKGGSAGLETDKLELVSRLWLITTVLTDIMIAGTMSYILYKSQEHTSYKNTKRLVGGLILQSIETAAVTAINMILCWLCYDFMHWNSVYIVWEFASGPLYGNVFLFALNSRREHRIRAGYGDDEEFTLGNLTTSLAIARPRATISFDTARMSMSVPCSRVKAGEGGVMVKTEVKVKTEIMHAYEETETSGPDGKLLLSRSEAGSFS